MSKKLSLLIVANNIDWKTWPEKCQELHDWFKSKVELDIDVATSSLNPIPFSPYISNDPRHVGWTNLLGIEPKWYNDNVSVLGRGYDLLLFVVNKQQWAAMNRARGWRADRDQGPVEMQLTANEKGGGQFSFMQVARHEIMHALFMLTGQEDTTHKWWDLGKLENALAEIVWPTPNNAELQSLLQKLFLSLMPKPQPSNKITQWALAIQKHEGWFPAGSPGFPTGSKSWRNNNPGNFKYVGQYKATGQDKTGFAIFPSYEIGFEHLCTVLRNAATGKSKVYSPNMSLLQFFQIYAPSEDNNNPAQYAQVVAQSIGVDVSTPIRLLV